MRTKLFSCLALLSITLTSCMKHASDYIPVDGEALNTWTFKGGKSYYFGNFQLNAVLDTIPQNNNTYTLKLTGTERASGQILTMVISLNEPRITHGNYQSGISGSDHATSFSYSGSSASRDAIYSSSNNNPGAVMTFSISHYDSRNKIATISFKGEAFDATGNMVKIEKGKLTAKIDIQ